MHPLMVAWLKRWDDMNPSWRHYLWTESVHPNIMSCARVAFSSFHSDLLARACHLAQRANIWRYEIVNFFGGVYVDTDVEPLRPLDDALLGLDAFAVPRTGQPDLVENAFFGAEPGHPWTRDLCRGLDTKDPAASLSMGVHYFTEVARRHPGVTLLPESAFVSEYPNPDPWIGHKLGEACREPPANDGEMAARYPQAYAAHHWSSHWFPEGFRPIRGERG